jgi:hypothetical protein
MQDAVVPSVAHALAVRAALAVEDYPAFFRLYATAPHLGRALMDLCMSRVRFGALNSFCKAFRPSVSVAFLLRVLGFLEQPGGAMAVERPSTATAQEPLPGCSEACYAGRNAAQVMEPHGMLPHTEGYILEGLLHCHRHTGPCSPVGAQHPLLRSSTAWSAGKCRLGPDLLWCALGAGRPCGCSRGLPQLAG